MQRLLSHPLTIALFTALAIIFFVSLNKNAQTAQTSINTLQALESQNWALEKDVRNLEEQVAVAKTDLAQEKIIRDELLLQKAGEFVVQLPADVGAVNVEKPQVEQETAWEGWKKVLL